MTTPSEGTESPQTPPNSTGMESDHPDHKTIAESPTEPVRGALTQSEAGDAKTGGRLRLVMVGTIAVLLAIATAFLAEFYVMPMFVNHNAKTELAQIANQRGTISPMNTKLTTFTGTKIEDVNVDQKALVVQEGGDAKPAFMFSNGKSTNPKLMEVYVDFSSQQSRDFLLMNAQTLRGMVEGGVINLHIIPVPTGDAFSLYAAEAIAESMYTSPDKSWDYLLELLRMGATVDTNKARDIIKIIVDTATELEIKDVDKESIENGTFASWIVSSGNDSRLNTGFYPPLVYVQGKLVDPKTFNLNNSDEIRKVVNES